MHSLAGRPGKAAAPSHSGATPSGGGFATVASLDPARDSPLAPTGVATALRRLGLSPRKALGQHFLVAPGVLSRIAEAADVTPDDLIVEVGPGLGHLTDALARRASRVVALELDRELATALEQAFTDRPNVKIVHADALTVDLSEVAPSGRPYAVVANLPYYAATAIVRRFLEAAHKPDRLVVMVQREVAQGMAAPPGRTGLLGIAVRYHGTPRIVGYVRPGSFHPPPKVTSAIVRIDVHPTPPVRVESEKRFFALVRAGFAAPRKQLRGGLSRALGVPPGETERALRATGLDPTRRAETLTLEEWAALHAAAEEAGWGL